MNKIPILLIASLFAISLHAALPKKPNILLILSDDAGYADFGFQGSKDISTPNLDALAKEGVRFTQGYAEPVCSPSRAALMSGKQPARIGHENNLTSSTGGIDTGTILMSARLQALGYHTGAIGKWHLGWTEAYWPWKRGFDYFYGFLGGMHAYVAPPNGQNFETHNGKKVVAKGYLTDVFTSKAVSFIDANKSVSKPWFLYLAYNAVHEPMQAKPSVLKEIANIKDPKRRVLAAMTVSLDEGVGKVLAALKASGQASNTLVVFFNDNGGATYSRMYNVPLRGFKGTLFEGGIRVPFLMRWPGVLKPDTTYKDPIMSLDLLPTFVAAAGGKPAMWADSDGVNLLPFITGKDSAAPHKDLFWRFNVLAAVREGDWKLIRIRGASPLLFNLGDDLSERHNVAAQHPDLVRKLLAKIAAWEKSFPKPKWYEGARWEHIHFEDAVGPPVYQGPISVAPPDRP